MTIVIRCPRPTRKPHMVTAAWFVDATWHCARCGVHGHLEEKANEIVAVGATPMSDAARSEWARKLAAILAEPAASEPAA